MGSARALACVPNAPRVRNPSAPPRVIPGAKARPSGCRGRQPRHARARALPNQNSRGGSHPGDASCDDCFGVRDEDNLGLLEIQIGATLWPVSRKHLPGKAGAWRAPRQRGTASVARLGFALALMVAANCLHADQVEMKNGDRYIGSVLSMNAAVLVLQNDVLGTVKLPRGKVSHITMGTTATPEANSQPAPQAVGTNANFALPQLKTNATSLQQVRAQFLSDDSPEARAKFNGLAGGLLTGKLSVADIRAEARSAADQLRALKADLGEDAGFAVDGYLAILDRFLNDGKPAPASTTNAPAKVTKPKVQPFEKEE